LKLGTDTIARPVCDSRASLVGWLVSCYSKKVTATIVVKRTTSIEIFDMVSLGRYWLLAFGIEFQDIFTLFNIAKWGFLLTFRSEFELGITHAHSILFLVSIDADLRSLSA